MASSSSLNYKMSGDASGAVRAFEQVARATKKNNELLSKQGKTLKNLDSGGRQFLRNMTEGMLKLPFKAMGKGFGMIGRSVKQAVGLYKQLKAEAVSLAREGERASRRLDSALKANVGTLKSYRKELDGFNRRTSKTTGVAQADIQGLQATLLPQMKNSGPAALRDVKELTRLILNLSAQSGRGLGETSDSIAELVSKGEFESLAKFGLNRTEVDALKAKKQGGDQTFVRDALQMLDRKSQGAATGEGRANLATIFRVEVEELLEKAGNLFVSLENEYLRPMLGPLQGINDALTGADYKATFDKFRQLFSSGGFSDVWADLKAKVVTPALEGLAMAGKGLAGILIETFKEAARVIGVTIENGIRVATGRDPITSQVDRVQQLDGTFRETTYDRTAFRTDAIKREASQLVSGIGRTANVAFGAPAAFAEAGETMVQRSVVKEDEASQQAARSDLRQTQMVYRPREAYL